MRLQTFPRRKRRENQYRFYFDDNYSEYKSFYAYSEYEAIEKAIKIIRKKLVKQAILELEAAKKDWRVVYGDDSQGSIYVAELCQYAIERFLFFPGGVMSGSWVGAKGAGGETAGSRLPLQPGEESVRVRSKKGRWLKYRRL